MVEQEVFFSFGMEGIIVPFEHIQGVMDVLQDALKSQKPYIVISFLPGGVRWIDYDERPEWWGAVVHFTHTDTEA